MQTKLFKISLITLVLLGLALPNVPLNLASNQIQAEEEITEEPPSEELLFEEPEFPLEPSISGRAGGIGTYFETKDSEYLSVILRSTEEIKVVLESIPRMISLDIELSSFASFTSLTIEGLELNKTYYKYEDSYKNEAVFISDRNGSYNWAQDLTQPHHIWFQETRGTIFLPEDCETYGVWNEATRTCILNQDLTQSVEISQNNFTLDCNGHKISGMGTGYGIYMNDVEGVSVKNGNITDFSFCIYLLDSTGNKVDNNTISPGRYHYGIWLTRSNGNEIANNTVASGRVGINLELSLNNTISDNTVSMGAYSDGIMLKFGSSNNLLISNTVVKNGYCNLSLLNSSHNTLVNNTLAESDYRRNFYIRGSELSHFVQDIDTSNTVDGKPIYYLVNEVNRVIDTSTDAGFVGVVNSANITVKDLTLEHNSHGVLFVNTEFSIIENIKASDVYYGIYLLHSSDNALLDNHTSSTPGPGHRNYGVFIKDSSNTTLRNNTLSGIVPGGGFHISGSELPHFIQDIDTSNIANGKPIYYLVNEHERWIPREAGFVAAINSTNITVKDVRRKHGSYGVLFVNTSDSRIENLYAPYNEYGVYLLNSSNNEIMYNYLDRCDTSIYLLNSSDNTIDGNEVESTPTFIVLDNSHNNSILNNKIKKMAWGESRGLWGIFGSYGIYLSNSDFNTISANSLLVYHSNHGAITLQDSDNNTIMNNSVKPGGSATKTWGSNACIYVLSSSHNTVANNTISFNRDGYIALYNASDNIISSNIVNNNNQGGMAVYFNSNRNRISNNEISFGSYGIYLSGASQNQIMENIISDNSANGITLSSSLSYPCSDNRILNNEISRNYYAIQLRYYVSNNKIYHNNFVDNDRSPQAGTYAYYGSGNLFDDGYPSGGNYWSDYTGEDLYRGPNQDQPGSDGTGDAPYTFTGGQDKYPFMKENGWEEPVGVLDITVSDTPDPFTPPYETNTITITNTPQSTIPCEKVTLSIENINRNWQWENLAPSNSVQAVWDGKDGTGNLVSDGTYTYTATGYQHASPYFEDTETGTITVVYNPDLSISPSLEFFNDEPPFLPNVLKIRATVTNEGNAEAENVIVKFTLNGELLGEKSLGSLEPDQTTSTDIRWEASSNVENATITAETITVGQEEDDLSDNTVTQPVSFYWVDSRYNPPGFCYDRDAFSFSNSLDWKYNYVDELTTVLKSQGIIEWAGTLFEGFLSLLGMQGHCFGMASASTHWYLYPQDKPIQIPTYQMTLDQEEVKTSIIKHHWAGVFTLPQTFYDLLNYNVQKQYDRLLDDIKHGLPVVLALWDSKPVVLDLKLDIKSQHAVTAYSLLDLGKEKRVFVYDNEVPLKNLIASDYAILKPFSNEANFDKFNKIISLPIEYSLYPDSLLLSNVGNTIKWIIKDLWNSKQMFFWIHSPVAPLLVNEFGQRIGYIDNTFINEIPEANMGQRLDSYLFFLPSNFTYSIEMIGTDTGTLGLDFVIPLSESRAKVVTYKDIPVTPDSKTNASVSPVDLTHQVISDTGEIVVPESEGELNASFILSAKRLIEKSKETLESAKTGDKIIDKNINLIIKHIEKSLEDSLWKDEIHLDSKHGKKVFHEEHKAVKRMQKEIKKKKIPEELKEVFKEVISKLVEADETLARVAIEDTKLTPAQDPKDQKKVDHEIEKAEKELAKTYEELEKCKPDKAIKKFEKAWEHAQKAIKLALKQK